MFPGPKVTPGRVIFSLLFRFQNQLGQRNSIKMEGQRLNALAVYQFLRATTRQEKVHCNSYGSARFAKVR